jgi:hypothetical protein
VAAPFAPSCNITPAKSPPPHPALSRPPASIRPDSPKSAGRRRSANLIPHLLNHLPRSTARHPPSLGLSSIRGPRFRPLHETRPHPQRPPGTPCPPVLAQHTDYRSNPTPAARERAPASHERQEAKPNPAPAPARPDPRSRMLSNRQGHASPRPFSPPKPNRAALAGLRPPAPPPEAARRGAPPACRGAPHMRRSKQ